MNRKHTGILAGLFALFFMCNSAFSGEVTKDFNKIPVKGNVTMIDLGAHKCIPCKMMAPILTKLEKAYDGKADIVFIDVWQNKAQAQRFGIRGIPTQIFFDAEGKEIYRHTGFMDEKSIVEQLTKMNIPAPESLGKKEG